MSASTHTLHSTHATHSTTHSTMHSTTHSTSHSTAHATAHSTMHSTTHSTTITNGLDSWTVFRTLAWWPLLQTLGFPFHVGEFDVGLPGAAASKVGCKSQIERLSTTIATNNIVAPHWSSCVQTTPKSVGTLPQHSS